MHLAACKNSLAYEKVSMSTATSQKFKMTDMRSECGYCKSTAGVNNNRSVWFMDDKGGKKHNEEV